MEFPLYILEVADTLNNNKSQKFLLLSVRTYSSIQPLAQSKTQVRTIVECLICRINTYQ